MRPLDEYLKKELDQHLDVIGEKLNADAMAIISPIGTRMTGSG